MRRIVIVAVAAALAAPAAAGASVAPTSTPARLSGLACHQALRPAARAVSVQAVMRPLAGTRAMQLRFALDSRAPGSQTRTPVQGGGLDAWMSPADPTLGQRPDDVWKLDKTVSGVAVARYAFAVGFRWLGAGGAVLATRTLHSAGCAIRETRPDLLVRSIAVGAIAGPPARDRYVATVANRGATGAGRFQVLFDPGVAGVAATTRTIGGLAAGAQRTETFVGPVCSPADPPTVVADATAAVPDANRSNNARTAICPAVGGSLESIGR